MPENSGQIGRYKQEKTPVILRKQGTGVFNLFILLLLQLYGFIIFENQVNKQ
jgi:hypothetical protein